MTDKKQDTQMPSDFKHLRHRWEMPLLWISFLVTILTMILGFWIQSLDETTLVTYFGEESETAIEIASYAPLILIAPIGVFFYRFYMAAQAKSNAIKVGPNQLPRLWDMYVKLGEKLEMQHLPSLYVTNGNGVVNAYALSCNTRRKYIVMHSETVIAYDDNPQIVEFVLAHELAHHKLGHVSLWRVMIGLIPNTLVPLGLSTTRAQEYSADRVAKTVCGHDQEAMKLLAVGPWMVGDINEEAWGHQCRCESREFYVRCANIMSSHAVLSKRYKALRDMDTKGLKAHGEMF